MSKDLSHEDRQQILAAQADAKKLLQDPDALDKRFEELYRKYDKNNDGSIEFKEYQNFITDMLISMGRTKVQSQLLLTYFQRADKDDSGQIDKEEFKKELIETGHVTIQGSYDHTQYEYVEQEIRYDAA